MTLTIILLGQITLNLIFMWGLYVLAVNIKKAFHTLRTSQEALWKAHIELIEIIRVMNGGKLPPKPTPPEGAKFDA